MTSSMRGTADNHYADTCLPGIVLIYSGRLQSACKGRGKGHAFAFKGHDSVP
jgi:hypothetical protein